jgi:hypothetical protein
MVTRYVFVPPFSRRWWSLWRAKAVKGEPTAAMVRAARSGKGWQARFDAMPNDCDLVAIKIDSPEFRAWRLHFQMMGAVFPTPSRAPVAWLPAGNPPGSRKAA